MPEAADFQRSWLSPGPHLLLGQASQPVIFRKGARRAFWAATLAHPSVTSGGFNKSTREDWPSIAELQNKGALKHGKNGVSPKNYYILA